MKWIWSEISPESVDLEMPQWHRDVLDERNQALQRGHEQALDWDEAKKQIDRVIQ